jgi:hypothetical protein
VNCKILSQLYIRVNVDENIQKTRLFSSSTGFSLQPWFSKTNSYLQIYTPEKLEPIECGNKIELDIKLKSKNLASGKINFQIQSRSSVLYSGSYDLETRESLANIDESILKTDSITVNKFETRKSQSKKILLLYLEHFNIKVLLSCA